MTLRRFVLATSLLALPLSFHEASAKKDKSEKSSDKSSDESDDKDTKEIEKTGVKEFDDLFTEVKGIHDDLGAMESQIKSSREGVATAMGLAKDTTFADSFAELKKRGGDKLTVALNDKKMPELKAEDAAPDDVKTATTKVNDSTNALISAKDRLPGIKDKTVALKDQVAAFPGKIDSSLMKKNDLSVTDLPKVMSKTKTNISVTASTPDRAVAVGKEIEEYFKTLTSAFTGGTAPATSTSASATTAAASSTTAESTPAPAASPAKTTSRHVGAPPKPK